MTPSFIGLIATMLPGVRPSIPWLPCRPPHLSVDLVDGDTDGSLTTMPLPRIHAGIGRAQIDRQVTENNDSMNEDSTLPRRAQ